MIRIFRDHPETPYMPEAALLSLIATDRNYHDLVLTLINIQYNMNATLSVRVELSKLFVVLRKGPPPATRPTPSLFHTRLPLWFPLAPVLMPQALPHQNFGMPHQLEAFLFAAARSARPLAPFTPQALPHRNLKPSTLPHHTAAHTPIGRNFFWDERRGDVRY